MTQRWHPAYVGIGSNLNQPQARVAEAFERLSSVARTQLVIRSQLYRTQPMGPQDQPYFVNAAAGLLTQLAARELLVALLDIERMMGRNRAERWGPRIIDLDLLCMPGEVIQEVDFTLPHPGVSARNFVLYPLRDIAPTLMISGQGTVVDLSSRVDAAGISILR